MPRAGSMGGSHPGYPATTRRLSGWKWAKAVWSLPVASFRTSMTDIPNVGHSKQPWQRQPRPDQPPTGHKRGHIAQMASSSHTTPWAEKGVHVRP